MLDEIICAFKHASENVILLFSSQRSDKLVEPLPSSQIVHSCSNQLEKHGIKFLNVNSKILNQGVLFFFGDAKISKSLELTTPLGPCTLAISESQIQNPQIKKKNLFQFYLPHLQFHT